MKKYFWMVFAVAVLAACGGKDTPQPTESLTLSVAPQELSFSATESVSKLVVVTSNGDWKVSSTESWIHVNSGSGSGKGSFSVSVDVQDKAEDRSGSVQVSASKGSDSKAATISVKQSGAVVSVDVVPAPAAFDGTKRASTTYQLLIYSFADSDGDGVGDFKGIQNKLDYLDGLGVTALWLSPAHPSGSYHGYEVSDYAALNPLYGTEEDFKALLDAAHAKGISIYMDFVLNHSGTGNEWFKSVTANPKDSPYNDYYVISDNPDAGAVDNFAGTTNPGMGRWFPVLNSGIRKESLHFKLDWTGSKKKVTVSRTTESVQSSNPDTHVQRYIYFGNDKLYRLYETSSNIYEITVDYDSDWGFLVRTSSSSWSAGTKYGGNKYKTGAGVVKLDVPYELEVSVENGYDPGNLVPEGYCYFGSFGESMPDLNYGKYTECENSPVFKATVDAAAKWVNMGVDGFRLDAVLWIYQAQLAANQRFLDQWYQAVNKAYREAGHSDNIFVVGEAWEDHSTEKQYYKGLISNFEFNYGGMVSGMLGNQNAGGYVTAVNSYVTDHTAQRADAVTSFFLTNHDQDRFAEWVGKSAAKEKQAAALLLSGPGKPFVYQGEELGYYGTKSGGDEYVRAPILWDKAGTDCAKKGVNNKVDTGMLKADISVEAQDADAGSLLNVYKTWSRLRNTYPALAEGTMTKAGLSGTSIAAWYMTSGSQKLLVIHNVASSAKEVKVTDSMAKPVGLLGKASVKEQTLTLGANSSVVFEL